MITDKLGGLCEPFEEKDIEWRIQSKGWKGEKPWAIALAYVTNRAIQSRLDDVCGPFNWKNEYSTGPNGGIICGLSIYDPEKKEWVTKWDGAENTDIDAVKGGLSNSMKRAGAQWGIGRYLYRLEAGFAECSLEKRSGWNYTHDKAAKKGFYWKEPSLPVWALPKKELEAGSAEWDKVVLAIKEGKRTLEQAMQRYKISKATQTAIEDAVIAKDKKEVEGKYERYAKARSKSSTKTMTMRGYNTKECDYDYDDPLQYHNEY